MVFRLVCTCPSIAVPSSGFRVIDTYIFRAIIFINDHPNGPIFEQCDIEIFVRSTYPTFGAKRIFRSVGQLWDGEGHAEHER